jgi:predicted RNase H-like nuclease (RuvC/YqgF family)
VTDVEEENAEEEVEEELNDESERLEAAIHEKSQHKNKLKRKFENSDKMNLFHHTQSRSIISNINQLAVDQFFRHGCKSTEYPSK